MAPIPDLRSIPVDYLESYPLPAFVIRVRAPRSIAPVRPPIRSRDTDNTIQQVKRPGREQSGSGSVRPASSAGPSRTSRSPSLSSVSSSPSAWLRNRSDSASVTEDETDLTTPDIEVQLHTPGTKSPTGTSPSAPSTPRSMTWIWKQNFSMPPVNAPLASTPILVWSNPPAIALTNNRPLHDVVEPYTLAVLQSWAEASSEPSSQHPSSSFASPSFTLEIGHPLQTVDLIKTRLPVGPDEDFILVVLTATQVRGRTRTSGSTAQRSLGTLKGQQKVVEGPHPLSAHDRPPLPGSIIPSKSSAQAPHHFATKEEDPLSYLPLVRDLLHTKDWSDSPLGHPDTWAPEIRAMVDMVFSSFDETCVYVGPEMCIIYNQNYAHNVDHPRQFGRPAREVWSELWSDLGPVMHNAYSGVPIRHQDDLILLQRNSLQRYVEWYHSFSLIPFHDKDNNVLGIYNPSHETTHRVVTERRLATIRDVIEQTATCRSQTDFFDAVIKALSGSPSEAPFTICYSVQETDAPTIGEGAAAVDVRLMSTLGVPSGHKCAPSKLTYAVSRAPSGPSRSYEARTSGTTSRSANSPTLSPVMGIVERLGENPDPSLQPVPMERSFSSGRRGSAQSRLSFTSPSSLMMNLPPIYAASPPPTRRLVLQSEPTHAEPWPIARALMTRRVVLVEDCSQLIQGFPVRHWNQLPDMAVVIPLAPESSTHMPPGVMILGLNLYRPLDTEYEEWIQALRNHLSTALASSIAYEDDMVRQNEKERLDRAKVAWFRGSAREFRTPLTLIAGPLEDLQNTQLADPQRQKLSLALKNVHRLQKLVTSLVDLSRMQAGHIKVHLLPTDMSKLVQDVSDIFRPAIERVHLAFTVTAEPLPAECTHLGVDPVLMEMYLSNLLLLSLKTTTRGGVRLDLKYEGTWAVVTVTDSGSGVRADSVSMIDEGAGSGNEPDSSIEGMGIGMALVREIIHLHGGSIEIKQDGDNNHDNAAAPGSSISARIPLVRSEDDENVVVAPQGSYARQLADDILLWREDTATEESSAGTTASDSQLSRDSLHRDLLFEHSDRLLIVDSSKSIRDYIKSIFAPFCTVFEAGSADEAYQVISHQPPHLILCDEDIVDRTGTELLFAVRDDPETKVIPVVFLSSANDDEARVHAFLSGADDFIAKPFKSRELLLRVHLHMQIGKKQAALEKLFAAREHEIAVLSDYCPSGILRADAYGSLTYVNAAFLELAGMQPDETMDQWTMHCDDESRPEAEEEWDEIVNGDRVSTKIQWKWNTGRTMSGVFIRLDKVSPSLRGIIGCVTDISYVSYQEERLLEAEQRRQEAEEQRHQQELLIDLISHEIRTPVSAILQCSSVVKDNLVALKDQLRSTEDTGFWASERLLTELGEDIVALDSIFQCGLVQERIAGDVLSFARIQLEMLSVHAVEMDLRREARKVLSVFAAEARMKRIDIRLLFGSTLEKLGVHSIKTDPVRLGQVVTNLISNAIRFTAASEVRRITVTYNVSYSPPVAGTCVYPGTAGSSPFSPLSPSASRLSPVVTGGGPLPEDTPVYLFVSVTDTGPGMGPGEKEVLFQRFQQGNKMIHTRYGGSGLGLFICKKITELLGGGIEVQSELGRGSVFNFYICAWTVSPTMTPELLPTSANSLLFSAVSRGSSAISPGTSGHVSGSVSPLSPLMSQGVPLLSPLSIDSTHVITPPERSDNDKAAGYITHAQMDGADADADEPRPLHVLIVEDNIINQTVLKRQIIKAGLTCDVANHGQDALNLIHAMHAKALAGERQRDRASYDVILMDLEMPVMDGLTALRNIRAAEAEGRLDSQLVIALTGNARQGQIEDALKAGMNDVVIKPYRLPELISKMDHMVRAKTGLGPEPLQTTPTAPATA